MNEQIKELEQQIYELKTKARKYWDEMFQLAHKLRGNKTELTIYMNTPEEYKQRCDAVMAHKLKLAEAKLAADGMKYIEMNAKPPQYDWKTYNFNEDSLSCRSIKFPTEQEFKFSQKHGPTIHKLHELNRKYAKQAHDLFEQFIKLFNNYLHEHKPHSPYDLIKIITINNRNYVALSKGYPEHPYWELIQNHWIDIQKDTL